MDKQAELNEFAEDVKSLSSREKAALVVVSLGSDRASQIYKYLSEQVETSEKGQVLACPF